MLAPDITVILPGPDAGAGRPLQDVRRRRRRLCPGRGLRRLVLERLADAGQAIACARSSAAAPSTRTAARRPDRPTGPAQEAVIRAALANAGLTPDDVDAIEAHGTGTASATRSRRMRWRRVFKGRDRPLWVGSVKSNIGHAEAAAGVAGLIKAVLMAERGAIPPSLHFHQLNPHIDPGATDIRVPVTMQPVRPRAVGVSSFGFSGTNAHILVAPATERPPGCDAALRPSTPHAC